MHCGDSVWLNSGLASSRPIEARTRAGINGLLAPTILTTKGRSYRSYGERLSATRYSLLQSPGAFVVVEVGGKSLARFRQCAYITLYWG